MTYFDCGKKIFANLFNSSECQIQLASTAKKMQKFTSFNFGIYIYSFQPQLFILVQHPPRGFSIQSANKQTKTIN